MADVIGTLPRHGRGLFEETSVPGIMDSREHGGGGDFKHVHKTYALEKILSRGLLPTLTHKSYGAIFCQKYLYCATTFYSTAYWCS